MLSNSLYSISKQGINTGVAVRSPSWWKCYIQLFVAEGDIWMLSFDEMTQMTFWVSKFFAQGIIASIPVPL